MLQVWVDLKSWKEEDSPHLCPLWLFPQAKQATQHQWAHVVPHQVPAPLNSHSCSWATGTYHTHRVRQAGPQLQQLPQCPGRGHHPRDCPLTHPEPRETPWKWIKLHHKPPEDSRTSPLCNPPTTMEVKIRVWQRFCLQTATETFKQQKHHQQKSGSRSWKANSRCKLLLILHALSSKIGQNS